MDVTFNTLILCLYKWYCKFESINFTSFQQKKFIIRRKKKNPRTTFASISKTHRFRYTKQTVSFHPYHILLQASISRQPLAIQKLTKMELHFSTTLLKFKPPLSLFSPTTSLSLTSTTPLLLEPKKCFSNLLTLSYSRQFFLPQHPSHRNSTQFTAFASTVSVDSTKDRLPADVEVTETEEPNSRVSL